MSQILFLFLVLSPLFVFSYNVDTGYAIVHTDPSEPGGSNYFGYSVALSSRTSSQPASLLVGAPQTSNGVGRVYRCIENEIGNDIENRDRSPCQGIGIDGGSAPKKFPIVGEKFGEHYDVLAEKSGGLGVSMATRDSSNFTVCAPLSIIHIPTPGSPGFYANKDMRGYCYDYVVGDILRRDNDILKIKNQFPFTQNIHSQYGFSVNYAAKKDSHSTDRITSMPGLNWVEIQHDKQKFIKSLRVVDGLSNLGYSVSTGYFFDSNHLLFAAGAPGWLSKGKVMIYDLNSSRDIAIEGSVLGEYFGSSLATGDFDGDGLDDLAVGASHWGEVDFGRVYTFYSNRDGSKQKFQEGIVLQGEVGNGQFGYTLAATDLDSDGYSDLVVSAPWENSGVVYIHYGYGNFRIKHSSVRNIQRIEPSQFRRKLQVERFGFSLSNSIDIDENGYPDLAIGAYKSGQAFVLRSKPVIETEVKLISDPIVLTKSTSSFVVSVCVRYYGKKAPNTQVLQFEMSADADHKRVNIGAWKSFTHRFTRDTMSCSNQTILLKNHIHSFFNPILIDVKHSIKEQVGNEFCSSCPVLSKKAVREGIKPLSVPFSTGCKGGTICTASLSVSAKFGGTGPEDEWVVGSGDISLSLIVTNDGEPAYDTELVIDIPPRIRLRNAVTFCRENWKDDTVSLTCSVADPLGTSEQKSLSITLDMEEMVEETEGTVLTFNITRRTRSVDQGPENPTTSLGLTVKHASYITVIGITDRESYEFGRVSENMTEMPILHTYQVVKMGSRKILDATLTINIPASIIGRNDSFLSIADPSTVNSLGHDLHCSKQGVPDWGSGQLDAGQAPRGHVPWDRSNYTITGDVESTQLTMFGKEGITPIDGTIYLNCSTAGVLCYKYQCVVALVRTSDDSVSFALNMSIDAGQFYTSKDESLTVKFSTDASLEIVYPPIEESSFFRNSTAVVVTMLYNVPEPQKLAGWIIPTSIIFGILLFCLLAVILLKVGFFNRPKKVQTAAAKDMEMILESKEGD